MMNHPRNAPSSRTSEAFGRAPIRDPAQEACAAHDFSSLRRSLRWVPALVAAKGPLLGRDDDLMSGEHREQ